MSLLRTLWAIPAVDQHAHNVNRPHAAPPFEAAFSESSDAQVWRRDTIHGLFYRRSLHRLSSFFGCDPNARDIGRARAELSIEELTARCFQGANLSALVLDDGLSPDALLPWDWHQQFVPTWRLLRLEHLAQGLMAQHARFEAMEESFRAALQDCGPEVVGYKCIAAYRGGLSLPVADREEARVSYSTLRKRRLGASPLYSYLVGLTLEVASRKRLPVQFHTGFGDPDLDLTLSNPLLLRPLVERYSCPFVLLHAGYPYARELGFLASVYPNVWTDFGLAIPFLSTRGMCHTLSALLELAPLNKVMYSSDASLIPELFYLGAVHGRETLAEVLSQCQKDGDLSWAEAEQAGAWILGENAQRLYGFTGAD